MGGGHHRDHVCHLGNNRYGGWIGPVEGVVGGVEGGLGEGETPYYGDSVNVYGDDSELYSLLPKHNGDEFPLIRTQKPGQSECGA